MYFTQSNVIDAGDIQEDALLRALNRKGLPVTGADFLSQSHRTFGIEDARTLKERVHSKPLNGAERVFVITAGLMTEEAQNALLKTIEEPPEYAYLFFLTPSPANLLPTFLSRANIIRARDLAE